MRVEIARPSITESRRHVNEPKTDFRSGNSHGLDAATGEKTDDGPTERRV